MPPKPKTAEEVNQLKKSILDCAVKITARDGYDALSMRKIAACVGMSATNIYNYFHNKDEVYLAILTNGFELLYQETDNAIKNGNTPLEKFENAVRAYIDFGMNSQHYYEIMFSSQMPKYSDYIGKPHEDIAENKMQTALKWFKCFTDAGIACLNGNYKGKDSRIFMIRIVAQLHGVLNLYHNNVIIEAYEYPKEIIDETIEHVLMEMRSKAVI